MASTSSSLSPSLTTMQRTVSLRFNAPRRPPTPQGPRFRHPSSAGPGSAVFALAQYRATTPTDVVEQESITAHMSTTVVVEEEEEERVENQKKESDGATVMVDAEPLSVSGEAAAVSPLSSTSTSTTPPPPPTDERAELVATSPPSSSKHLSSVSIASTPAPLYAQAEESPQQQQEQQEEPLVISNDEVSVVDSPSPAAPIYRLQPELPSEPPQEQSAVVFSVPSSPPPAPSYQLAIESPVDDTVPVPPQPSTSSPSPTASSPAQKPIPFSKLPSLIASPPVDFTPPTVQWRGMPLQAAQWTLTSSELQELVSRAIRSSARESFVRLLPIETLDRTFPEEMMRLDGEKGRAQAGYTFNLRRRTMLLQAMHSSAAAVLSSASTSARAAAASTTSLSSTLPSSPHSTPSSSTSSSSVDAELIINLAAQLAQITAETDRVTETLLQNASQQAQIQHLEDVHFASALAIALRKLNGSYAKRAAELVLAKNRIRQLQAEVEDAWSEAERLAAALDAKEKEVSVEKVLEPDTVEEAETEDVTRTSGASADADTTSIISSLSGSSVDDEETAIIKQAALMSMTPQTPPPTMLHLKKSNPALGEAYIIEKTVVPWPASPTLSKAISGIPPSVRPHPGPEPTSPLPPLPDSPPLEPPEPPSPHTPVGQSLQPSPYSPSATPSSPQKQQMRSPLKLDIPSSTKGGLGPPPSSYTSAALHTPTSVSTTPFGTPPSHKKSHTAAISAARRRSRRTSQSSLRLPRNSQRRSVASRTGGQATTRSSSIVSKRSRCGREDQDAPPVPEIPVSLTGAHKAESLQLDPTADLFSSILTPHLAGTLFTPGMSVDDLALGSGGFSGRPSTEYPYADSIRHYHRKRNTTASISAASHVAHESMDDIGVFATSPSIPNMWRTAETPLQPIRYQPGTSFPQGEHQNGSNSNHVAQSSFSTPTQSPSSPRHHHAELFGNALGFGIIGIGRHASTSSHVNTNGEAQNGSSDGRRRASPYARLKTLTKRYSLPFPVFTGSGLKNNGNSNKLVPVSEDATDSPVSGTRPSGDESVSAVSGMTLGSGSKGRKSADSVHTHGPASGSSLSLRARTSLFSISAPVSKIEDANLRASQIL